MKRIINWLFSKLAGPGPWPLVLLLWATAAQAGIKESIVIVNNGDRSGSGIIVGMDAHYAYGVSAAHCFVGKIGGAFEVVAHDGSKHTATLKAHETRFDVALFITDPYKGFDVSPIARGKPATENYVLAGYPSIGPDFAKSAVEASAFSQQYVETPAKRENVTLLNRYGANCFQFITENAVTFGDSGGGVFSNGELVSVISSVDTRDQHKTTTCTQAQLVWFAEQKYTHCQNGVCNMLDFFCPKPRQRPRPQVPPKPYAPPPPVQEPQAPAPPPATADTSALQKQIDDLKQPVVVQFLNREGKVEKELTFPFGQPIKLPAMQVQILNPDGKVTDQDNYPLTGPVKIKRLPPKVVTSGG